jgi:hypothetical protein
VPLSDWLQIAEGSVTPTQQTLLEELGAMLDDLEPVALDRSRSRLTWAPAEYDKDQLAAEVVLVHVQRPDWSVHIQVEPSSAVIHWLSAHERMDETDGWDDVHWTMVVVDVVAAVLRGEYEVEETVRLGRWYRTRIIDVTERDNPETFRASAPLWFWLRRPFPATVIRRRLNFTGP